MITLSNKIKNAINLNDCMMSVYYSNIIVIYIDENGENLEINESISDLLNETGNFAIDVSNLEVSVKTFNKTITTIIK